MPLKLHHTALVTGDIEAATRFYRDGLGMEVTLDIRPEGDFTTLFNAHTDRLHSIFLSDPADQTGGILELVEFDDIGGPPAPAPDRPQVGFFLISFYVNVDEVASRLVELGYPLLTQIEMTSHRGAPVKMATVRDPDGVLVELIEVP